MNTLTIVGEPQSIGKILDTLHQNNPKMKIICHSAAPWVLQHKTLEGVRPVNCHVVYLTYEGPPLVDHEGNPIKVTT